MLAAEEACGKILLTAMICTADNGPAGTPVPNTPGQTPAPGTYNMVTTTTDCTGTTVQYSWVPGMRGVSRNTSEPSFALLHPSRHVLS